MKELKFRAWDNENQKYFEPTYRAFEGELEELLIGMNGSLMLRGIGRIAHSSIFPDRFVLEQFTGLKDKNGADIFEGDTVAGVDRYFIEPVTGVVEFHGMSFVFNGKTKSGQKWLFTVSADNISSLYEIEVTGNIHQVVQNGPT